MPESIHAQLESASDTPIKLTNMHQLNITALHFSLYYVMNPWPYTILPRTVRLKAKVKRAHSIRHQDSSVHVLRMRMRKGTLFFATPDLGEFPS